MARSHDGGFVLQYGKVWRRFVEWMSILMAGIFVFIAVYVPNKTEEDLFWLSALALMFTALIVPAAVEVFKTQVIINPGIGIAIDSPWTRSREIVWADVEKIEYSTTLKWFSIRSKTGTVVRVNRYLSGIGVLTGLLADKLEPGLYENALNKYQQDTIF